MKIIEKKIEISDKTKPIILIPIGNIHIGNPNFNKKAFEKIMEQVKNPNTRIMFFEPKEEQICLK